VNRRGLIKAAIPALLLPANIVQTAPSFFARIIGFYVLLKAGITVPYQREVTEGMFLSAPVVLSQTPAANAANAASRDACLHKGV
jgi:hypothetical protein